MSWLDRPLVMRGFIILPLSTAAGVAVSVVVVSVDVGDVRASPVPSGKVGHRALSVVKGGKNNSLSG